MCGRCLGRSSALSNRPSVRGYAAAKYPWTSILVDRGWLDPESAPYRGRPPQAVLGDVDSDAEQAEEAQRCALVAAAEPVGRAAGTSHASSASQSSGCCTRYVATSERSRVRSGNAVTTDSG